ncbi:helix-turn-helix domain-containing protein [Sphingomonas sp. RB56-2]|uniref:Helix-turn-helix domain-containing protein n=1 Tax=Sphingomonas brevis TaxID=2908206 RepID=A0ABT0SAP7_9SPHN|nr:helix-turn-helix domain-containing protein [Sphingomonas brevis]MCL6741156.1 helix-turn-helix domain-containing protein [Sphingomonas brevis]
MMIETNPVEQLAFRIEDTCRMLGISRFTLYAEINAGRLFPCKVGRRTLFTRTEMERWLRAAQGTVIDPRPLSVGAVS